MEVQKRCVNARGDISATFHRGAFHESESSSSRTLNKIAAVFYRLYYMKTHTLAATQFFYFFLYLLRE